MDSNNVSLLESFFDAPISIGHIFDDVVKWYTNNQDKIAAFIHGLSEYSVWFSAVEALRDEQIVFTDDLSFTLAHEIVENDDVKKVLLNYYYGNNESSIRSLIERCSKAEMLAGYSELYSQIISAYERGHYHLACLGLFAVLDGLITDTSEMIKTSFNPRIQNILDKVNNEVELNEMERKDFCVLFSMEPFDKSIFKNSDFSNEEPDYLNRHWVMHGRTHRCYSKLDFLKVLLWVDAIVYLSDKTDKKYQKEIEDA